VVSLVFLLIATNTKVSHRIQSIQLTLRKNR